MKPLDTNNQMPFFRSTGDAVLRIELIVGASLIAIVVGLIFCDLSSGWIGLWPAALIGIVAALGVDYLVSETEEKYLARIQQHDSVPWQILLNRVAVAQISDADYAAIQLSVLQDPRIARQQLVEVIRCIGNLINTILLLIPAMAFWTALMVFLFDIPDIKHFFDPSMNTPDSIQRLVVMLLKLAVEVIFALFIFSMPKIRNCFSGAVRNRVDDPLLLTPL
ncbi:MAG: hypothetical protein FIA97_08525 [Methylococcaceae bacterium]|nr:hypothetical protein [Methylococcaceae bacterium]